MTVPAPEEIRRMLAVSSEFLREAEDNAERNNVRSAATAAYYAVYHAARALLAAQGIATKTHKGLIQNFGQHFIQTKVLAPEYGQTLTDLHDDRQAADYLIMTESIETEAVQDGVRRAKEFITAIEKLIAVG